MTNEKYVKNDTERDEETIRFNKLLKTIYSICSLAGFRVEERIVLKDKRTGKIWR